MQFTRYAIYYTPEPGALATFGAHWLGWDIETGTVQAHPEVTGLDAPVSDLTETPRKYGLHGTIKPPFRLKDGRSFDELAMACEALAEESQPVELEGLRLSKLGRFLALTVKGDQSALADLAAMFVKGLDAFRAPATPQDLARRRKANLSPRQDALLVEWGYPYVLDEFKFHITLTGRLPREQVEHVTAALAPVLDPILPEPFEVSSLTLVGEDEAGMFHKIQRYALTG